MTLGWWSVIFDMASNPFKLGDAINLDVSGLYPIDLSLYKPEYQEKMNLDNLELTRLFKRKKVELMREEKYIDIKLAKKSNLVIEYYCSFVETFVD